MYLHIKHGNNYNRHQNEEAIMVKCIEEINVPRFINKKNKNSLIRKGITIVSPVYNPDTIHNLLKVDNISPDTFTISKNLCIAQMDLNNFLQSQFTYNNKSMHHSMMNGNRKDYLITKIIMKKERLKNNNNDIPVLS